MANWRRPAHWIAVRSCNPQQIDVGTKLGVFASEDGDTTWQPSNKELAHRRPVCPLSFRYATVIDTGKGTTLLSAIVLIFAVAQPPAPAAPEATGVTTVVLVRHAEKADGGSNPELSGPGRERAAALALAVADLKLDAVVVTDTKRAQATGAPAAQARGLTPIVVPVTGGAAAHAKAVADAVLGLPPGSAVLVVGHSNTLGPIIAALGGPELASLCEKEFARLVLLEVSARGAPARLLRASYGAADPPGAGDCGR